MKKLISILLVLLLLFNVLGYYGLFLGLRFKTSQNLVQRLDANNYSSAETVTLKLPMTVPYNITQQEYVRVDGEIEHGGEFYRLVKQKLANDTLYIVCIKDVKSTQMKQVLTDHVKTFSDKAVNDKQNGKTLPGFIKDYLPTYISITSQVQGCGLASTLKQHLDLLLSFNPSIPSPPPKS